jgi:hypothetical protein
MDTREFSDFTFDDQLIGIGVHRDLACPTKYRTILVADGRGVLWTEADGYQLLVKGMVVVFNCYEYHSFTRIDAGTRLLVLDGRIECPPAHSDGSATN